MPVGISFLEHDGYGAGTVDGIATNGWKVRDRILKGTRFCVPVHTTLEPTQAPVEWVQVFPWGKSGRGVTLNPHFLLVPWSRKLKSKPLLHLRAIRPVHSLSACTVQL